MDHCTKIFCVLVSTYQSQFIGVLVAFCIVLGASTAYFTMKRYYWYTIFIWYHWKHHCIHLTTWQPLNIFFVFSLSVRIKNTKRNNMWRINQKLLQNRDKTNNQTYTQMKLWTLIIKNLANSRNLKYMIQFNNNLSCLACHLIMTNWGLCFKKPQDYKQGNENC